MPLCLQPHVTPQVRRQVFYPELRRSGHHAKCRPKPLNNALKAGHKSSDRGYHLSLHAFDVVWFDDAIMPEVAGAIQFNYAGD